MDELLTTYCSLLTACPACPGHSPGEPACPELVEGVEGFTTHHLTN